MLSTLLRSSFVFNALLSREWAESLFSRMPELRIFFGLDFGHLRSLIDLLLLMAIPEEEAGENDADEKENEEDDPEGDASS